MVDEKEVAKHGLTTALLQRLDKKVSYESFPKNFFVTASN